LNDPASNGLTAQSLDSLLVLISLSSLCQCRLPFTFVAVAVPFDFARIYVDLVMSTVAQEESRGELDTVMVLCALFGFPSTSAKIFLNSYVVARDSKGPRIPENNLNVVNISPSLIRRRFEAWGWTVPSKTTSASTSTSKSTPSSTFPIVSTTLAEARQLLHLPGGTYNLQIDRLNSGRYTFRPIPQSHSQFPSFPSSKYEKAPHGDSYLLVFENVIAALGDDGRISRAKEPFWSIASLIVAVASVDLLSNVVPYCTEEGFVEFRWNSQSPLYLQIWYNPENEGDDLSLDSPQYYDSLFLTFSYFPGNSATVMNKEFSFSNHTELQLALTYLNTSKSSTELAHHLFSP